MMVDISVQIAKGHKVIHPRTRTLSEKRAGTRAGLKSSRRQHRPRGGLTQAGEEVIPYVASRNDSLKQEGSEESMQELNRHDGMIDHAIHVVGFGQSGFRQRD